MPSLNSEEVFRVRNTVSWPRRILVTAVVVALFVISTSPAPAATENQCVACHEAEQLPISLGHSFDEWRGSAHGRSGVGCEKCHGGDPRAKDVATAHAGVLPAHDPKSLVSTRNLARTCGGCHQPEYDAYAKTVHAKEVAEKGQGATCYTCHGSMATTLPSASVLSTRCAECHKKSMSAMAALLILSTDRIQLWRTSRTLDEAASVDPQWHGDAVQRLHAMEHDLKSIELTWHTFDLEKVLTQGQDLLKLVKLLDEEAKVRMHRLQH